MYEERNFTIFNIEELSKINFDQVLETSADTVRVSLDGTKTFVKWNDDVPLCVQTLTTKSQYYTYLEILQILNGEEWTSSLEIQE